MVDKLIDPGGGTGRPGPCRPGRLRAGPGRPRPPRIDIHTHIFPKRTQAKIEVPKRTHIIPERTHIIPKRTHIHTHIIPKRTHIIPKRTHAYHVK